MSNKLLIVGNASSHHIIWFAEALKESYPSLFIDIYNINIGDKELKYSIYNKVYPVKLHYPKSIYKIPLLRGYLYLNDITKSFIEIANTGFKYNAIFFLGTPLWEINVNCINRIANKTIIYPFGSEVLRCNWYDGFKLKRNFDAVNLIATIGPTLKNTLLKKYKIKRDKIVDWYLGIDSIENFSNYSRDNSKLLLGLSDKYVITCGYNGYKGQNHFKILKEINKIKNKLPENYILLILLSYGCNSEYVKKIRTYCKDNGLNCFIVDSFLSSEELIQTRFATDIFIHAQPTDNCSNSIYEFLLSGAKMINGSWIRYTHLEKHNIPYFMYNSFNELGSTILNAIKEENRCTEKTKMLLLEGGRHKAIKNWVNYIMNE